MSGVDVRQESQELVVALDAALRLPADDKMTLMRDIRASLEHASPTGRAGAAVSISKAEMLVALREADCLYDDEARWRQLGATGVIPPIPDDVIQKAYAEGGRIVYRCSSIDCKAQVLRQAGCKVYFDVVINEPDFLIEVSDPGWIVVPSHIDPSTLGKPKHRALTDENPPPTQEDLFGMHAYARLEGRQVRGYEDSAAFAKETGAVVASYKGTIKVERLSEYDRLGFDRRGAAAFGPPRNQK